MLWIRLSIYLTTNIWMPKVLIQYAIWAIQFTETVSRAHIGYGGNFIYNAVKKADISILKGIS